MPILVGAVIYDPKVSVIWDIIADFFRVRTDVGRALDRCQSRMPLFADNSQVHEDVVEAAAERNLDRVKRNALPFGGALQTAHQVSAERPQHVLHRARRFVRVSQTRLRANVE